MALSTLVILMLMNGLAIQEAFSSPSSERDSSAGGKANISQNKYLYYIGCIISGISGCLFPILWTAESKAALVIPTSVIGGSLLPVAYLAFILMMNSSKIMGSERPTGRSRLLWNGFMGFALTIATVGSVWVLRGKAEGGNWFKSWQGMIPTLGLIFIAILFIVGILSFLKNEKRSSSSES